VRDEAVHSTEECPGDRSPVPEACKANDPSYSVVLPRKRKPLYYGTNANGRSCLLLSSQTASEDSARVVSVSLNCVIHYGSTEYIHMSISLDSVYGKLETRPCHPALAQTLFRTLARLKISFVPMSTIKPAQRSWVLGHGTILIPEQLSGGRNN
jgi:hypothetical protein